MEAKKLALLLFLLTIFAVLALFIYKTKRVPPKIELVSVSKRNITKVDDKTVIIVEFGDEFEITLKTSPKFAGKEIRSFCDSVNFTQEHPYKGRECGGYGIVDDRGYCVSRGWVAETPPGWVIGLKFYLIDRGERIEESELEIYVKVKELPPAKIELVNVSSGDITTIDNKTVIEVVAETYFNITFKTSPRFAGMGIVCYCDSINFTLIHPYKGRECGGYGIVDDQGYCISDGWYADAPPGWIMGLKCYLEDWRGRIEMSELEIYIKVVERP